MKTFFILWAIFTIIIYMIIFDWLQAVKHNLENNRIQQELYMNNY
jgi:hypothetical protein